jgi:hypothetical protein
LLIHISSEMAMIRLRPRCRTAIWTGSPVSTKRFAPLDNAALLISFAVLRDDSPCAFDERHDNVFFTTTTTRHGHASRSITTYLGKEINSNANVVCIVKM